MWITFFFFFVISKLYQTLFTQGLWWLAVWSLSNAAEIINLYTSHLSEQ